jgi:putative nucleotidyltransferase with HDIG domain
VLDDPTKGAADVAAAIAPDAGLCARILHLANSPYFGSAGRVSSLERAVVTVGSSVVRSLAISTAAGLLGDGARVPEGFWVHSGAVGVASSLVARHLGLAHADAWCAGLLHDLGSALAYRHDRALFLEVGAAPPDELLAVEADRYGADHAELGAIALRAWRLPAAIVDAVGGHHAIGDHHPQVDVTASPLHHAVVGGEALVRVAFGDVTGLGVEPAADPEATLTRLALSDGARARLERQVASEGEELGAVLVAA